MWLCSSLLFAALGLTLGASPLGAHDGSKRERSSATSHHGDRSWHDDDDDEGDDDDDDDDHGEEDGEPEGGLPRQEIEGLGPPRIRYVPGEILVRFRPGTQQGEVEAAVARAQGQLARTIPELGMYVVAVSPSRTQSALASLRSEPSVESVERDVVMRSLETVPNDALWSTQWGSRRVGAPRAWDTSRGTVSVVIAVIDTGVDPLHPDLVGATVAGRDFVQDDSVPSDDNGHGTAAAGVLAARTNNLEGQSGICWACALMPVKVLDSNGSGKTSTLATGIVWAADHGARVVNMSLGSPGTTSLLASAVSYAARKGVVLVAAAGNSGVDTPFYPAAYSDVISVAATDEVDARYSWSNFGDWVQVAAPGCNTAPWPGNGYVEFCGTSSAAPMVSGIAGLAFSLNPVASKSEVEQALASSASPLPGVSRFGRVNAPSVMSAVSGNGGSTPPAPPAAPQPPPPPPPAAPASPPPPPPSATPPPTVTRPVNVRRPRLRGSARVGRSLRVVPGAWKAAPVRFAYRWQRCARNGARCHAIPAARRSSYKITPRDRRHRLRAVVVAVNAGGSSSARSGASALVRVAPRR